MADKKEELFEKSKIPGGVYQNAGGDGFHNGNGDPVTESGKIIKRATPSEIEEDDAWMEDMKKQRAASEAGKPLKTK